MTPGVRAHRLTIDLRGEAGRGARGAIRDLRDPIDGNRYVIAGADHLGSQNWFEGFPEGTSKVPVTVDVQCPPEWGVVGVGPRTLVDVGHWQVHSIRPLAAHLVGFVAGPMCSTVGPTGDRAITFHSRASLSARLDRDAGALTSAAAACVDVIAELVGAEYPWPTCEFVFVPGARRRAMEYPGGVHLRESLLPASALRPTAEAARVVVLAHELAHMWFGNLVTPEDTRDVWLFEALAELLGQHAARSVAGDPVRGVMARRRMSALRAAHRCDAPPLGTGGATPHLVDYVKGAAALSELCAHLGGRAFTDGLRSMLAVHRDGVASADQVIAHWSEIDRSVVARWRRDWLGHRGRWPQQHVHALDLRADRWSVLQADVADGSMAPQVALDRALGMLATETDGAVFDGAVSWLIDVLIWRHDVNSEQRVCVALEAVLSDVATGSAVRAVAARYWIDVAGAEPLEALFSRVGGGLRWCVAARLAVLGVLDTATLEVMRREDQSPEAAVSAARCRGALPDADAKEAAWLLITDVDAPVAERVAAVRTFFHPRHRDVTAGFVPRYFAALRTAGTVAEVLVRHGFPHAADHGEVLRLADEVAGDPSVDDPIRSGVAAAVTGLRLNRRWARAR